MMKTLSFNIFAEEEEDGYLKLQKFKDRFFHSTCKLLKSWNIRPDTLSYLGLLMVLPFIFFFSFHPWFSFLFLMFNLLFDGLDGALARFLGKQSARGEFLDRSLDYTSFFIFFLTFLYYNLLSPFWGAIYLLNYVVMLSLILFCRTNSIKFFPVIRSKYYTYLMFFILLVTGNNYFDPFLVLFSVYMIVTNIFLFQRIRWALS